MLGNSFYIKEIILDRLFNYKNINWSLFEDVNILGGVNGSGKSTILKIAYQIINSGYLSDELLSLVNSVTITFTNMIRIHWEKENVDSLEYVRQEGFEYLGTNQIREDGKIIIQKVQVSDESQCLSFNDIKNNIKVYFIHSYEQTLLKNDELSTLGDNIKTYLDVLIYKQIYQRNSKLATLYKQLKSSFERIKSDNIQEQIKNSIFNDLDIKQLIHTINNSNVEKPQKKEIQDLIHSKVEQYVANAINDYIPQLTNQLSLTESRLFDIYRIMGEFYNSSIVVEKDPLFTFKCKDNSVIDYTHLSTGEKQLLLILLMVFNTEDEQCVFFMDEPDLSMHIDWKEKFVTTLRDINPNMQLVIATHAPSMVEGWFNNVKEVCQISEDLG